jgi:hypothetical protein
MEYTYKIPVVTKKENNDEWNYYLNQIIFILDNFII